jgi:hypothetical protein
MSLSRGEKRNEREKATKNIIGIVLDESLTMENCDMNIERDLE